jgi:lipopolysaccharide biosynthesis glycosyltransferase
MAKPNVIAIAVDAAMFPAAVFLAHKLAAMNPRDDARIAVLSNSAPNLQAALRWGLKCDLRLIESAAKLPQMGRISGAAFYRLFVPQLVEAASRVLYLDADTYPDSDALWRLFDLDMGDHAIAAIRDFHTTCSSDPAQRRELDVGGSPPGEKYLNSGVLLIDVARYAERNLADRFLSTSIKHSAHDQAAINRVLLGDWLELSPAFNMTPWGLVSLGDTVAPAITHFMGADKPWFGPKFGLDHRARREMEAFFPATPWHGFLPAHYSLADALAGTRGRPPNPPSDFVARLRDYLVHTPFADVEQGLTAPPTVAAAR